MVHIDISIKWFPNINIDQVLFFLGLSILMSYLKWIYQVVYRGLSIEELLVPLH